MRCGGMLSALWGGIGQHLKKKPKSSQFILPWNESMILEYGIEIPKWVNRTCREWNEKVQLILYLLHNWNETNKNLMLGQGNCTQVKGESTSTVRALINAMCTLHAYAVSTLFQVSSILTEWYGSQNFKKKIIRKLRIVGRSIY